MTKNDYGVIYEELTDLDASMDEMLNRFGDGLSVFFRLNVAKVEQEDCDETIDELLSSLNDVKVFFQHLTDAIENIEATIREQRDTN